MGLPTSIQLLQAIETSEILTPDQLLAVRERVEHHADDVKALAKELVGAKLLTRWQANQLMAGQTRFTLGKYKLIDLIGRGAIGNVFRAEHTTMGRVVALKVLVKKMERHPAILQQFYNEARVMASLDHRHIVHVYNIEHVDDRHFIVMEHVDGADLQTIVERRGRMTVGKAAEFIRQAAEGLAYAHARGYLHCDVKPSNLALNKRLVLKILDMGAAKQDILTRKAEHASRVGSGTRNEVMQGTVDYMAPELAIDDPATDHRADIYSLGCVLYFLLAGHPPFPHGTLAEKILKHQTEAADRLEPLRPDAPKLLTGVCHRMMDKDPAVRPPDASAVAKAMEPYAEG